MSWADDMMIEQDAADALNYMGEADWKENVLNKLDNVCGQVRSTQLPKDKKQDIINSVIEIERLL